MSTRTTMPRSGLPARANPRTDIAFTALVALVAAGCEATFTPGPLTATWDIGAVGHVEPPTDVSTYPHGGYSDRGLSLIDGSGYAPTRQGWTILREEPRELGRCRTW